MNLHQPKKRIVVAGSSNVDLTIKASRLPQPGETVIGDRFLNSPGGKGANQAVAASRLGGDVSFVSRIGCDIFGDDLAARYGQEAMDCTMVTRDPETPTGVATITVDSNAENCIVVAPGANSTLGLEEIEAAAGIIASAGYLLMQLEIPAETVLRAKDLADKAGVRTILNPAPAAPLDDRLLHGLYMITPNRSECSLLTGIDSTTDDGVEEAAKALLDRGVENVVVTLGSRGALICNREGSHFVPSFKVAAVDTTAAGDVFNGALAVALAEGRTIAEAARFASAASAISVTRMGAQNSIPRREEVDEFILRNNQNSR